MLARIRLLAFSLFTPLAAAQGQVHVVDWSSAPGSDFTSIDGAVKAAADGDLILVRSGTYLGPTIDGKSLTIAADEGATVYTGGIPFYVLNLPADGRVLVQGIRMWSMYGFEGQDNLGSILLENCELAGQKLWANSIAHGAWIRSSSSVTLVDCDVKVTLDGTGNHAIRSVLSNLQLYDCRVEGAKGIGIGTAGGVGIAVQGGTLFSSGSTILGGAGADPIGPSCTAGNPGATGILGLATLVSDPLVRLLDSQVLGGKGTGVSGCPTGPDGVPVDMTAGVLEVLPDLARHLELDASVVRAGDVVTLTLEGEPGDLARTVSNDAQGSLWLERFSGLLVPARSGVAFQLHGTLGATGSLQATVPTILPPGAQFGLLLLQPLNTKATSGALLGTPRTLLVLDPAL